MVCTIAFERTSANTNKQMDNHDKAERNQHPGHLKRLGNQLVGCHNNANGKPVDETPLIFIERG